MYYIPLIVILIIAAIYLIGNTHCSIKAFDALKDGQTVYVCLNPTKKYEEMKVHITNGGKKYAINKEGIPQFRITLLDIASMSVVDENEYEELMQ